jgi:predicted aconitase with swiveling domain
MRRLLGRSLVSGAASGTAVCSDVPLSFWGGINPNTGEVIDRRHPLFGACLSGKVLVLPFGRGSCSASGVLFESIRNGVAPAAILVSHIDPIIALGSILGDEVYAKPIPLVLISDSERAAMQNGDSIAIEPNGTVTVTPVT